VRRYDPPTDPAVRWVAAIALVFSIAAALPLLWFADRLPMRVIVAWALAVTIVLWVAGAAMQRRLGIAGALGLQLVATAAAVLTALA